MSQTKFDETQHVKLFDQNKDYIDTLKSIYRLKAKDKGEITNLYNKIKTTLIETKIFSPSQITEIISSSIIYNNAYLKSYLTLFKMINAEYNLKKHEIHPNIYYRVFPNENYLDFHEENTIFRAIMKDDRSSLIVFIKDDDGFDTHQMMDSDYYPDGYLSLLELCCYHGAVDCFKIFRTKFNFKITKRCLELAFIGGNPDIMSECLKVNKPYKRCMKYAIASHNIDFVCYLMNEHNIDIDLKYCCKFNNLQAFLVYLDQTNNINDCFIYSPMFNMPSLCEYLISHGADVNTTNPKNQTTLHLAAKHSNKRVVEFLISHGANINAKDSNGRIALHSAITYPTFNLEIIEFLVLHGAEINAKENKYGYTPLHKSTSETMTDIAVFLIEHGADIKSTDIKGQTPLHHAVDYNNVELVKLLISKGAEIDAQDLNGETALHLAALNGNTKMVEILLINGANVNAKNVDGVTVLQKASVSYYTYYETNREEIDKTNVVEYLILYGAIINETDNSGDMALHYAAFSNNIEAIKLLLLYGAIVDAKDKDGWSAYKIADARRYNEIIEILTKNGSTEQPSTMNFNFNVFPQFGFF